MSRTYKKNPYITDNSNSHEMKKIASRVTRRKLNSSDSIITGSKYKRFFDSYDICDYKFRLDLNEAISQYNNDYNRYSWFREKFPTIEDYIVYWKKNYRAK